MIDDILISANLYTEGLKLVEERRAQWIEKHAVLKKRLTEIADYLNEHSGYKQGYYVDSLQAFNEEIKGSCAGIPSLTFRSGKMPLMVEFCNEKGEEMKYMEDGFRIEFTPTITGQVIVILYAHQSPLSKNTPDHGTLAFIDNPGEITLEVIDEIINKGIETAFSTSFTGIGLHKPGNTKEDPQPEQRHNPIGFKRYETTEK